MATEDYEDAQYLSAQVEKARQRAVLAASDAGASHQGASAAEQSAREYSKKAGLVVSEVTQARDDAVEAADRAEAPTDSAMANKTYDPASEFSGALNIVLETRVPSVVEDVVRPSVGALVAQAIADDSTVASAAAAAVDASPAIARIEETAEVASSGFVPEADQRMLRLVESEYAIPFGDADGWAAGGFKPDGTFDLKKPISLPDRSLSVNTLNPAQGVGPLDPNTGFIFGSVDVDGYVSWGVRTDGSIYQATNETVVSRTHFNVAGDSMVKGGTVATDGGSHETWPYEDSWPAKLQALIPGSTVLNNGFGGRTIDDVRWHTGTMDLWVEFPGGIIPAEAGEHPVIVKQAIGSSTAAVGTFYGWAGGTNGNLKKLVDGSWVFDKYNATSVIPVPGKVKYERRSPEEWRDYTHVLWAGRNDTSFNIQGAQASTPEHVEASMVAWVKSLRSDMNFLILGVTNRVQEPEGSANYETVKEINRRLRARWPEQFIDMQHWLVHEAIYEAGYTPTSADLANMALDAPPPQIMDQGTHYLKPIAPFIAAKVLKHLEERGYC